MGVDLAIAHLASRQHGVFTKSQALTSGLSNGQVRRRLGNGTWVSLSPGVYALASAPPTWHRQMTAAVLSRAGSIVGGRSAAYLLGFGGFGPGRPEVLIGFTGNARSPIARVIRSRHFDLIARTRVDGFAVTSPAETVLTLSYRLTQRHLEKLIDESMAAHLLTAADFDPIFARLTNAPLRGLKALRRIVGQRDRDSYQPPTSELERLLYRLLDCRQLPQSERQPPMEYPQLTATVDAYIPAWRLIVEADGRRWHTRVEDFERDRMRDNAAAAAGLQVVRFTYRMLRSDAPACLATLLSVGQHR